MICVVKMFIIIGVILESQTRPEQFTRKVIKTEKVKKPRKKAVKNK